VGQLLQIAQLAETAGRKERKGRGERHDSIKNIRAAFRFARSREDHHAEQVLHKRPL
jgi:hypothetical protein